MGWPGTTIHPSWAPLSWHMGQIDYLPTLLALTKVLSPPWIPHYALIDAPFELIAQQNIQSRTACLPTCRVTPRAGAKLRRELRGCAGSTNFFWPWISSNLLKRSTYLVSLAIDDRSLDDGPSQAIDSLSVVTPCLGPVSRIGRLFVGRHARASLATSYLTLDNCLAILSSVSPLLPRDTHGVLFFLTSVQSSPLKIKRARVVPPIDLLSKPDSR